MSETFPEQFARVQQQFKDWSSLDQLYATVELTRTLQLSYRHFLVQLLQGNIQQENNDMFYHTVDDANAPDIVTCLLSNTLDKILFTLQLYLPLISSKIINEKLLIAYRDVMIYLDSNILHSSKFSYTEQQIIQFSQQILFFIQNNPHLKNLLIHIPQIINLIQTKKFHSDIQQYHQPLQRFSSIRSQGPPMKTFASEGMHISPSNQQLTRLEINDSGVDLSEPSVANQIRNFLSPCSQQHTFVGKTASSPIPEHGTLNVPVRQPLKSVLSAPTANSYSDPRYRNSFYPSSKHVATLPKSDEDEQESQNQMDDFFHENTNPNDVSRPLGQFYSLRFRHGKDSQKAENVSPYLGVDSNSTPIRNTFLQPNTGMRDVPKWLKNLRLHKYTIFFSQLTYDEMMNLTLKQLKDQLITDGACSKILLHVKKLKGRAATLKQCLSDIENGVIELPNVIPQLYEILGTPIRSKQLELENNSDEDLPQLIMQILEKIFQQLTPTTPSDVCNSLLGSFDRCYRHEAFTDEHRHHLLQWRRSLSNRLQSLGRIEYKTIQSGFSHGSQQRRMTKPSVRAMKSASATYHSNYSSTSVPLDKYQSEPQNNNFMEHNLIRRPNKSPTQFFSANEDSNETNLQASFSCLTSTPQRNNGTYLADNQHQHLERKASISPYGENNTNNKTKLCKTFSDPSRIRFYTPAQTNHLQSSSSLRPPPPPSSQNLFHMISKPYSQQQRQFASRSPPITMTDTSTSPIKECYPDDEQSDYYEDNHNTTSISSISGQIESTDDQRHNNTDFESLCRQITESAINDDVNDPKEEKSDVSNLKPISNNSTDTEQ